MSSALLMPSRKMLSYAAMMLLLFGMAIGFAPAVSAQEDAAAPAAADAAAPAAAPANPPANNAANAPAPPQQNMLVWTYNALGLTYTVAFLFLSFTFVALLVLNILVARREHVCPSELIQGVEENLQQGNIQGAAELVSSDDSFLGRVLTAGFSRLDRGHARAVESMQEVGEEETMMMEHRLGYIALIGNVSPMVGLLGTVDGMVRSFTVIASNNTTPKPAELASGISTALVTTLVGLILAIPAIAIYNILRNRLQALVLEVGHNSERIMERFEDSK